MTATMKSNVLEREEKGIGAISFRRLLLAGLCALLFFVAASRLLGWWFGCASGSAVLVFTLVFTHPVGGFPLVVHAADLARGLVVVTRLRRPASPLGRAVAAVLQVGEGDGLLDASALYRTGDAHDEAPLTIAPEAEWVIASALEGDGLAFHDRPLAT